MREGLLQLREGFAVGGSGLHDGGDVSLFVFGRKRNGFVEFRQFLLLLQVRHFAGLRKFTIMV